MDQTTSTPQQATYIDVAYYPGITVYGMLPARLELKGDRLVLTTVEGTNESPIYKEIFNIALSEIQKVKSMLDEIKVVIAGKSYRVSVAQYAIPAMATGGIAGAAVAAGMYQKSGARAFLNALREKGITVSRIGYGKVFVIALVGAIVLIAAIAGIYLLTQ